MLAPARFEKLGYVRSVCKKLFGRLLLAEVLKRRGGKRSFLSVYGKPGAAGCGITRSPGKSSTMCGVEWSS